MAARPPSPESHGARLNLPGTSSLQGFAALFIAQNDENLCLLQEKCHGPGPHLSLLLPPIPLQGEPSVFSSGPSECHGQTKSHLCGWLQDRVAATAAWVDPGSGLRWLRGTLLPGPLFGNSGWGARDLCWAPARCLSACQARTMSSLPPMPQWGGGGGDFTDEQTEPHDFLDSTLLTRARARIRMGPFSFPNVGAAPRKVLHQQRLPSRSSGYII